MKFQLTTEAIHDEPLLTASYDGMMGSGLEDAIDAALFGNTQALCKLALHPELPISAHAIQVRPSGKPKNNGICLL